MKRKRPGILAVRAVNQYRRRDVLSYLALRYYLHSDATRTDQWARQVASNLVLTRTDLPYLHVHHFKDLSGGSKVDHRVMFLPSANEALAEAALLDECAKHPAFSNHTRACDDFPDGVVRYIDIKRFYPSISPALALAAWTAVAEAAGLEWRWRILGEELIDDHGNLATG